VLEKKVLSFSGCIRTYLPEVNIFDHGECIFLLKCEISTNYDSGIDLSEECSFFQTQSRNLHLEKVSLNFDSEITWNLEALVDDTYKWLFTPMASTSSKVGIFSSPRFIDLIGPTWDDGTHKSFQKMIYAESLAFTQYTSSWKHIFGIHDLHHFGAMAGQTWLRTLDRELKPQKLNTSSKEKLQALFLVLIGTILAVNYTRSVIEYSVPSLIDK